MNYKFSYKHLQIIKHALQHYVGREDADKKDIETEKRLLKKITRAPWPS